MLAQKKIYEKDIALFKAKFSIEDQFERLDQMDSLLFEKDEHIRSALEGIKEQEKKVREVSREIEVLKDESKTINKVKPKKPKIHPNPYCAKVN